MLHAIEALVQATEANKELMEAYIDREVVAGGTTDFIAALSKVKEVLGDGSTGNGCNRVVLFMSDGQPDAAPDTDALKADLDAIGNVRLMTYALGDGAEAGMKATADLESRRGRSAKLGARSKGHIDPGAASTWVTLRAMAAALAEARAPK